MVGAARPGGCADDSFPLLSPGSECEPGSHLQPPHSSWPLAAVLCVFLAVLSDFSIYLIHLPPSYILLPATFVQLCEIFVGVAPSMALLRHYFILRPSEGEEVAGSYNFFLRKGAADRYIRMVYGGEPRGWTDEWCYIHSDPHPQLFLPTPRQAPPPREVWERLGEDDARLSPSAWPDDGHGGRELPKPPAISTEYASILLPCTQV